MTLIDDVDRAKDKAIAERIDVYRAKTCLQLVDMLLGRIKKLETELQRKER